MFRRGVAYAAILVAACAIAACAVMLYRWWRVPLRSVERSHPSTSASMLPPVVHDSLGAESDELREILSGKPSPKVPAKRPRSTTHRAADLFTTNAAQVQPRSLPPLRNVALTNAHDARVDDTIRALMSTPAPAALTAAVVRRAKLHSRLDAVFAAWKVPEALGAIVVLESGYDPCAEEGDRVGLWGFRAREAGTYGLAMTEKYDERRAVALSTEVAAHYLRDLRARLGSWELAIGAFGTSYAHVLDVAKSGRDSRYWVLASAGKIPDDVASYVAQVLAIAYVIGNADTLHVPLPPDSSRSVSDLEVPSGTPFSILAEAAKVDQDTLTQLNPEFLTASIPPAEFAMYAHVPSESLARARELLMPLLTASAGSGLATASKSSRDTVTQSHILHTGEKAFYRVHDGDTLPSIASQFGVTAERIASDNMISLGAPLRPETLLVIRKVESP